MFCQGDSRAWLHHPALEFMKSEAEAKDPLETGGVLIGYLAQPGNVPVVLWAGGPGPLAIHAESYYRPDHEHDEELISTSYRESGRRWVYLGDWHTHPAPVSRLSWLDKRTLKRIAKYPSARVKRPVMLILSSSSVWTPTVWQGSLAPSRLWGKMLRVDELAATVF